jgi:uncharacterized membrane protein (DUF4010 family)
MPIPGLANLALLLGLSFFFGLAFEEFYGRNGEKRPGGIRTFPLLAIAGGVLYLLDAQRLLPLTAGLLVLGAWLVAYYRDAMREHDATGAPNVGLVVPACNLLAYLIGPLALAGPHWLAIGVTVAAVLFITGRERLHSIAERVDLAEIVTAGQFLILTGLILPLLPDEPVTTLTTITPYKVWLAVLAVCTISYASYLIRRYVAPEGGDVWIAALGGLYSSTATTVVLARRAGQEKDFLPRARAGIVLATSLMYPRLLVVIAVFNRPLAQALLPALIGLAALGLVIAFLLYRRAGPAPRIDTSARTAPRNPLELSVAALFAILFVAISIAASWVQAHFGVTGVEVLAAIVGVTDIDPFVLSLAQSVAAPLTLGAAAAAVLIASASNNLLKAWYSGAFAGFRASFPAAASLVLLAAAAAAAAFGTALEMG